MATLYEGETRTYRVSITEGGAPRDLTATTVYFSVSRSEGVAPVIARDSVNDPDEVNILVPATDGKVDCKIVETDWSVLELGAYRMDVWLKSGTSRLIAVRPMDLQLLPAVTDAFP